ncbi:MAG TPA: LysM peptidoglycan-binding domain-containing protein [Candidatus Limnocylindria bacterium]|nr:LysM peptidoglycan-binding domain-containing protein [Candidatus Limnocylindria bacterium]
MSIRPRPMALLATAALLAVGTALSALPVVARDRVITVRSGQTLSGIALAHGTTVRHLARLNHIADPNRIYTGQRLRLAPHRTAKPRARIVSYRVRFGETLTGIAARYGTSIAAIVRRNDLADASHIYVGQELRIAVGGRDGARRHHRDRDRHHARVAYRTIVVRFGDTVSGLALRHGVSLDAIVEANALADAGFIRIGQELRIPVRGDGRGHHGVRHHARSQAVVQMPASMAALVASRNEMRRLIAAEARRGGVPASFALAVAWQESGWQPRVVSSAGAIGVMQLLPATADWVGSAMLGQRVDLWQPRSNVRAGVTLLAYYLRHYHGDRPLALAAYYQGMAGTDRNGIYPVTRPYVASILLLQRMFAGR